jgi:hypothetical protein
MRETCERVHLCSPGADETMAENDPLLARLLAAATAGASPAGPAHRRAAVRIVLDPDSTPVAKGKLCGQQGVGHLGLLLAVQLSTGR